MEAVKVNTTVRTCIIRFNNSPSFAADQMFRLIFLVVLKSVFNFCNGHIAVVWIFIWLKWISVASRPLHMSIESLANELWWPMFVCVLCVDGRTTNVHNWKLCILNSNRCVRPVRTVYRVWCKAHTTSILYMDRGLVHRVHINQIQYNSSVYAARLMHRYIIIIIIIVVDTTAAWRRWPLLLEN